MKPSTPAIRIGTRGSALARAQAERVADDLQAHGHDSTITIISTRGDATAAKGVAPADPPVAALGGDGVFVRELQSALLDGRIDLAVHSLKDLPTAAVGGLVLACVPARETPFDVLVGRTAPTISGLTAGAVVGTSSIRRAVQVRRLRPDLVVREIRGNVDTRLRRLEEGAYDAIVLAAAGLVRLGLAERATEVLRPDEFWPAVGQGALGLETRESDRETRRRVAALNHPESQLAVVAERACLAGLAGGCLAPVGGFGRVEGGGLRLGGCVLGEDRRGVSRLVEEGTMPLEGPLDRSGEVPGRLVAAAEELGRHVAASLIAAGADPLLAAFRAGEPR